MKELLRCNNLTKCFGTIRAVNNLNLSLGSGRIVGLLGPNGSGKTTLIKMINGLLQPTEGSIEVCGYKPGIESKMRVSYLPDNNFLNSWMTVEQIIAMFAEFYADFRPQLAFDYAEQTRYNPSAKA